MNDCIRFAEWLRINFNNSPEEIDNYWEDIFYNIDNIRISNYTTEELYDWWIKNVKQSGGEIGRRAVKQAVIESIRVANLKIYTGSNPVLTNKNLYIYRLSAV